jgi:transcriptional regulator with XRE-family HTH domain
MDSIHPLRAYRENHSPKLTVRELARRLGKSSAAVSRWETGKRKPDIGELVGISTATGIPPEKLRPDLASVLGRPRARPARAAARRKRAA